VIRYAVSLHFRIHPEPAWRRGQLCQDPLLHAEVWAV